MFSNISLQMSNINYPAFSGNNAFAASDTLDAVFLCVSFIILR